MPRRRPRALFLLTAGLLFVSLLLGGAGIDHPLLGAAIQVGAIALLCSIAIGSGALPDAYAARLPLLIAAAVFLLPILHLIPLPPAIWTQLPGRRQAVEILHLTSLAGEWRPLSLDAGATLRSAYAVLPGIAMFLAVLHLHRRESLRLVYILLAMATASAVLGALQKGLGGAGMLNFYDLSQSRSASGFFINHNHQATFLAVAAVMTAAAARSSKIRFGAGPIRMIALALIGVFFGGAVATTSRMGFLLFLIACGAATLMLFPMRRSLVRVIGLAAAMAIVGLVTASSYGGMAIIARFLDFSDERPLYWRDAWAGIRDYWPVGSGLGTWTKAFPPLESLDVLGGTRVNNAHNDYVELALEAGAPALLILTLFLVFLATSLVRLLRLRREGQSTMIGLAAWIAILLILLHSIVDYPLRMASIVTVFGLLAGLLVTSLNPVGTVEERRGRRDRT